MQCHYNTIFRPSALTVPDFVHRASNLCLVMKLGQTCQPWLISGTLEDYVSKIPPISKKEPNPLQLGKFSWLKVDVRAPKYDLLIMIHWRYQLHAHRLTLRVTQFLFHTTVKCPKLFQRPKKLPNFGIMYWGTPLYLLSVEQDQMHQVAKAVTSYVLLNDRAFAYRTDGPGFESRPGWLHSHMALQVETSIHKSQVQECNSRIFV